MSCIQCKNLESCGTINRMLLDYGKETLVKELNKTTTIEDCKDFEFIPIAGEILKQKIIKMVELSKAKKLSLKSKLKTK